MDVYEDDDQYLEEQNLEPTQDETDDDDDSEDDDEEDDDKEDDDVMNQVLALKNEVNFYESFIELNIIK